MNNAVKWLATATLFAALSISSANAKSQMGDLGGGNDAPPATPQPTQPVTPPPAATAPSAPTAPVTTNPHRGATRAAAAHAKRHHKDQ